MALASRTRPLRAHNLVVPDDLLEWGKQPEVARRWRRPWAHDVEKLIKKSQQKRLTRCETRVFLARLEALCSAAIDAGRGKMLLGLDVFTAELLGVEVSFPTEDGQITVGSESLSYQELLLMREGRTSSERVKRVLAARDMVRHAFPGATVESLDAEPLACDSCGSGDDKLMYEMSYGSVQCSTCWSDLTWQKKDHPEPVEKHRLKRRTRGRR